MGRSPLRRVPSSCPKFQALCSKLRCNDATITSVVTDRWKTPSAYGSRLGTALGRNTVVNEITLYAESILSKTDATRGKTKSGDPLFTWLQQSASLQKVVLYLDCTTQMKLQSAEALIQRLLRAMAKNRNIHAVELSSPHSSHWPLVTEYLTATKTRLQSIKIDLRNTPSATQLEAAARAIGASTALESFNFMGWGTRGDIFLLRLQSHSTLRELYVDFSYPGPSPAFHDVVATCPKLELLALKDHQMEMENWRLLKSGLDSNPSIATLKLDNVRFPKEAATLFLNGFRSQATELMHIRHLHLSHCYLYTADRGSKLARMVCGSHLHHLSLDRSTLLYNVDVLGFFGVWAEGGAPNVPLSSLQLDNFTHADLHHALPFLSSAVHLRRFNIKLLFRPDQNVLDDDALLPLIHALQRRNTSLHHVQVCDSNGKSPSPKMTRIMNALATRNQFLPEMLQSSAAGSGTPNDAETSRDVLSSSTTTTTRHYFPALSVASMPVKNMVPNLLLQCLLPMLDDTLGGGGCSNLKRNIKRLHAPIDNSTTRKRRKRHCAKQG